ncbi:aromatic prenyltransferase [Mycena latifolia]|nr:aromatic prenyltransferase [Mycena latifolia]
MWGDEMILLQALSRTRLSHARRTVWWYHTIGRKLALMLELSRMPSAQRQRALRFFIDRLVPLFGPSPPEFYALPNCGVYTPIVRTPIELIWVLDGKRPMSVRFSMEMLDAVHGTPLNPEQSLAASLTVFGDGAHDSVNGFDSTWPDICYNTMLDHSWKERDTELNVIQFFPGGEFGPNGVTGKFYYPARAKATGEPPFNVISDTVDQLGLSAQWGPVIDFFTANSQYGATPEFVGIESVPPAQNRFKVYVRIHSAFSALNHISRIATLGGTLNSPAVTETILQFGHFWRLLYPNHRDDQPVQSLRPGTKGMLIYFELRPGAPEVIPKIYVPAYRFEGNDEHVARAITTYHRMYNQGGDVEKNYEAHFKRLFAGYDLKQKFPLIHTYIGMATKNGTTQMTVYLALDPFRVAHT